MKRARVASAVVGTRGRPRLEAWLAGEREPNTWGDSGSTHNTRAALERALVGRFTKPHDCLLSGALARLDWHGRQIAEIEEPRGPRHEPLGVACLSVIVGGRESRDP